MNDVLQIKGYDSLYKDQSIDESSLIINANVNVKDRSFSFSNRDELNPISVLVSQFQLESFMKDDCFMKKEKDELINYFQALELKHKKIKEINLKLDTSAKSQSLEKVMFQKELEELEKGNNILYGTEAFDEISLVLNKARQYLFKACSRLKTIYSENCVENGAVKHELDIVEESLAYCDEILKTLKNENTPKFELFYLWTKYTNLEEMYQHLSNEVGFVKDDFVKQLYDIAEVLASFENVALHFSEMKKVFLEQQETVSYKKDSLLEVESEHNIELNQCCQKSKSSNSAEDRNFENFTTTLYSKAELEERLRSKEYIIEELRSENLKYKILCNSLKRMLSIERLNMNEQSDELKALRSEVGIWKPLYDKSCENLKEKEDLLFQMKINTKNKKKEEISLLHQYLKELEEEKAIIATTSRNKPSKNDGIKGEQNKNLKLIDAKKGFKKLSKKKMSSLLTENFSHTFQAKYLNACKELIRVNTKNVKLLNDKVCFRKSKIHKLNSTIKRLKSEKSGLQTRLDDIEKDSFKHQEMKTYRELINQLSLKLKTKKEQLMESKKTVIRMEKLWQTEQQEVIHDIREALDTDWSFYESTVV